MRLKAVFFDVDGVLMQSDDAVAHMFNDCLAAHGFKRRSKRFILKFMGLPITPWLKRLLPPANTRDVGLVEKMMEWSEKHYAVRYVAKHARKPKGINKLLASLGRDYRLCVVTNESQPVAKEVLRNLGLLKFFPCIVGLEQAKQPKPSPAGLLAAAAECGCKPGEAVYVGDTRVDLLAGKKAGVETIIVSHPRNKKLQAKHRIISLSKLPALLKSI